MTNYLATLALIVLFVADYIGIIYWLMQSANIPHHTIRFGMRGLFAGLTIAAIHFGMFAAFLSELPPLKH
jgi:hypothetical protein